MEQGIARKPRHSPSGSAQTGRFETPILFIVFNRPETTNAVLESIRSVRPLYLYVAADGPRAGVEADLSSCEAARRIATTTDWPCELRTRFRDSNVGCGLNVSSAISWFFDNVEQGIILEDDCVPGRSFYPFCEELLEYHSEHARVMHIGGDNFQYGHVRGKASYYYSRFAHVWGWASWRRAWKAYDFNLRPAWELRDTWDTQWQLSIERAGGVAIVPNVNLVKNVGFGEAATHTRQLERYAVVPVQEIGLPLTHPGQVSIDHEADVLTYYANFRNVRCLRLIWLYQAWDLLLPGLKRVKRALFGNGRGKDVPK